MTALRLTQVSERRSPLGLSGLRLLAKRVVNLTPGAIANAKSEYTEYYMFSPPQTFAASRIPAGSGSWRNVGLERGKDKITSPPISKETPTWFMLSWDSPKPFLGLHLDSNVDAVTLYTYTGPDGVNPAVATKKEWKKIRGWTMSDGAPKKRDRDRENEAVRGRGPLERFIAFREPLMTRGIKIQIDGVEAMNHRQTSQVAEIAAIQAYSDLGEEAMPDLSILSQTPPFEFEYTVPETGAATLVMESKDGTRVRNLMAREGREAGAHKASWDLRDLNGNLVGPGTYHWRGISGPRPQLRYEMTAYPNVRNFHPENTPWRNGHSGSGGWLADHAAPSSVAAYGETVYLGSPCSESGESLAVCNTEGKRLWGHGNFLPWVGPSHLAANAAHLFVGTPARKIPYTTKVQEIVFRVDLEEHKSKKFLVMESNHNRARGMVGMAATDETIYLAIRATSRWLINACGASDVDIENCLPRYGEQKKSNKQFNPNPRNEFLRLLRLTGTPTGQDGELVRLESTDMPSRKNHTVVAFKRAVPLGSLVFPFPKGDYRLKFSVLKADAAYPPKAEDEESWATFYEADAIGRNEKPGLEHGWSVAAAPKRCTTRALRITFDQAQDELDDLMDDGDAMGGEARPWKGALDGLKLLRRRFTNLFPKAEIQVNSGAIFDARTGSWDARRTDPLTEEKPALYALTWKQSQEVRGLAIKEIDGKDIRIDVWEGSGAPKIEAKGGWREVATYDQRRRYYYQPDENRNHEAIYMDGYVDFGHVVKTRGVRIRITSQWTTREEGRAGLYGIHADRGGMEFDATRCYVYGVAPLKPLGGDVPTDPMKAERLEVFDAKSGDLLKELPLKKAGRLALDAGGALYGISDNRVVKMDLEGGKHTVVTGDVIRPDGLAFDRNGNLYVFDRDTKRRNVRVYDPKGTYLRSIGKPGGIQAGTWDPERIGVGDCPVDLTIDGKDQLWVVAKHKSPKRQSVWSLDGKHLRDHLGNTEYGGGGCLNPWKKTQLFYAVDHATLEFELDWETGLTRLKSIPWLGDTKGGEFPVKIGERLYLTTRPMFGTQGCGTVYLYEDGRMRPVAAIGQATYYPPLRSKEILDSLGTQVLGELCFVWSDLNGDGKPSPKEVTFTPQRFSAVSAFDRELGLQVGEIRYEVEKFLESGVPVYRERSLPKAPKGDPGSKMGDDRIVFLRGRTSRESPGHQGLTTKGERAWMVESEGFGVHALSKAGPLAPEQVVSEFDMIGYERAHAGDLGDFYMTNSNIGRWHLWTADGLLAGEIMRDRRDPQLVSWSMTECERGMDLTNLTPGPEHFRGYFCHTREDNKYYLVAGHNHISVVEVLGLDKYRRMKGTVEVTPEDIRRVQAWEKAQAKRRVYARAPLYRCEPIGEVRVDGNLEEWHELPSLELERVTFRMAHRENTLYVSYFVPGLGPFKNSGSDWRRMFKTGAGVDLQMSVKAGVSRGKGEFVDGDFRLLTTPMSGKPMSVLYQPVAEGAAESEAWETHTMVWQTAFDRVVKLPSVRSAVAELEGGGYAVEMAIPFQAIGLSISDGLRLKFDWGLLQTNGGGTEVLRRLYWANKNTHILADEAAEAQIQPSLWGHVIFSTKSGGVRNTAGGLDLLDREEETTEEDILDELEED
ncbi:MAG: hypothetical protein ACYTGH_10900 [Planctomycetota bacterium]